MKTKVYQIVALLILIASIQVGYAGPGETQYATAIFDFVVKSRQLSGMGEKVSNIVFANLASVPEISLVDRNELDRLCDLIAG